MAKKTKAEQPNLDEVLKRYRRVKTTLEKFVQQLGSDGMAQVRRDVKWLNEAIKTEKTKSAKRSLKSIRAAKRAKRENDDSNNW